MVGSRCGTPDSTGGYVYGQTASWTGNTRARAQKMNDGGVFAPERRRSAIGDIGMAAGDRMPRACYLARRCCGLLAVGLDIFGNLCCWMLRGGRPNEPSNLVASSAISVVDGRRSFELDFLSVNGI